MGSYYPGYSTFLLNNLGTDFDKDLSALAEGDGLTVVEELKSLVEEEINRRNADQELEKLKAKMESWGKIR